MQMGISFAYKLAVICMQMAVSFACKWPFHLHANEACASTTTIGKSVAGIVCKIAGIDPLIHYHYNPGQMLQMSAA